MLLTKKEIEEIKKYNKIASNYDDTAYDWSNQAPNRDTIIIRKLLNHIDSLESKNESLKKILKANGIFIVDL